MWKWMKNLFQRQQPTKIQKLNEVLMYEEEALKRLTRIAALGDRLHQDFEDRVQENAEAMEEEAQEATSGGLINLKGQKLRVIGRGKK